MVNPLSSGIIARLQERAGNAERRSEASELEAGSTGMDEMLAGMPKSSDPAVREYLQGMNTPFAGMIANLVTGDGMQAKGFLGAIGSMLGGGTMAMMGGQTIALGRKRAPTKAPPPASAQAVAAAEAELGFPLPAPLRQFYLEVADGGVGPGDGLYSLKQLLAKWREMTREPIGPRGQKWPRNLLPIEGESWDLIAIDRDSGKLIAFDIEEVDYGGWKKCFSEHCDSLEAWLGTWLNRPSPAERAAPRAERASPKQLSDEDILMWEADHPEYAEFRRRSAAYTATPEERAAMGLPEKGWEAKVFEGLDLSKVKHPMPGYAERRRARQEGEGE